MKNSIKMLVAIFAISLFSLSLNAKDLETVKNNYHKARGGEKALSAVKSWELKGKQSMQQMGEPFDVNIYINGKDQMRMEMLISGQNNYQVVNKGKGWATMPAMGMNEVIDLSENEITSLINNQILVFGPFLNAKKESLKYIGKEKIDSKEYFKIAMDLGGQQTNLFFDSASNLLYKSSTAMEQGGQSFKLENVFKNYKDVNGVKIPHTLETVANGQVMATLEFKTVKTNAKLDQKLFTK